MRKALDNCVAFLNKVKSPHAEDKGINICMEYLNSKVNHKDYMFDHIAWGVDVMKRVNSPRVKILYDIYHAQIHGWRPWCATFGMNFQWIGHFHTGGNPGRHDIPMRPRKSIIAFVAQAIAGFRITPVTSRMNTARRRVTNRSRCWKKRSRFATRRPRYGRSLNEQHKVVRGRHSDDCDGGAAGSASAPARQDDPAARAVRAEAAAAEEVSEAPASSRILNSTPRLPHYRLI